MMSIIIDKNTNLKKEEFIVKSLKKDIIIDKKRKDYKSLKYHSLALKEHIKTLNKLKSKGVDEYVR